MRTVVVGPRPVVLEALIAERVAKGLDLFDELWEGDYHMAPAPHPRHGIIDRQLAAVIDPVAIEHGLVPIGPFNLGEPDDYRVPDSGYCERAPEDTFVSTAVIVVEIVSPGDESFAKLPFYAARGVQEVVIVDPIERTVRFHQLIGDANGYREVAGSRALGLTADEVSAQLRWP